MSKSVFILVLTLSLMLIIDQIAAEQEMLEIPLERAVISEKLKVKARKNHVTISSKADMGVIFLL